MNNLLKKWPNIVRRHTATSEIWIFWDDFESKIIAKSQIVRLESTAIETLQTQFSGMV
jgi:hypothetical protein